MAKETVIVSFGMLKEKKGCCVGHYAHACGGSRDTFGLIATLHMLVLDQKLDPKLFPILERDKYLLADLYSANDDTYVSDEDRENQIKELFAKAGIEVTFV